MQRPQTAITVEEFSMDDYAVVHVLWQRGDLWRRVYLLDGRKRMMCRQVGMKRGD